MAQCQGEVYIGELLTQQPSSQRSSLCGEKSVLLRNPRWRPFFLLRSTLCACLNSARSSLGCAAVTRRFLKNHRALPHSYILLYVVINAFKSVCSASAVCSLFSRRRRRRSQNRRRQNVTQQPVLSAEMMHFPTIATTDGRSQTMCSSTTRSQHNLGSHQGHYTAAVQQYSSTKRNTHSTAAPYLVRHIPYALVKLEVYHISVSQSQRMQRRI